MKKLTFLTICFLGISMMANATKYFVDFSKLDNTGDGQSWETAKQTLATASALGISGDSIFIKGGTLSTNAQVVFVTNKNYFGSCDASNTGTTTVRSVSDMDANGIVEPWEFSNPTLLLSTNTSTTYTAGSFHFGSLTSVDGFVFTNTYSSTSTFGRTFTSQETGGVTNIFTFKNNIVRNCDFAGMATGSFYGYLTLPGTSTNCLIENNKFSITSTTGYNNSSARGLLIVNAGSKLSNFVIRNNQVNFNFSTVASGATGNTNITGLIMQVQSGATGAAVVKNVIINNNEINYTGSASPALPTATRGAVFSCQSTIATDSILNCTVANNKTTNLLCAGFNFNSSSSSVILQAYNNVAYNNYNTVSSTSTTSLSNMVISPNVINTGGLVSNNYTNGAGLTNGTRITNNDNTQTALNNTVFKFSTPTDYQGLPTAYAGNPVGKTAVSSLWSLTSGSYLTAKGLTSSNKYDKAGNLFTTIPSVGAYENTTQTFTTMLSIGANGGISGYTHAQVLTNDYATKVAYTIAPNSGFKVLSLLYNGVESKSSIVGGVFTAPALIGNATLAVTFDISTGLDNASDYVRIMGSKNLLQVEGLNQGDVISVYNLAGAKLATKTMAGNSFSISLNSGIYLVKINNKVNKVVVN